MCHRKCSYIFYVSSVRRAHCIYSTAYVDLRWKSAFKSVENVHMLQEEDAYFVLLFQHMKNNDRLTVKIHNYDKISRKSDFIIQNCKKKKEPTYPELVWTVLFPSPN